MHDGDNVCLNGWNLFRIMQKTFYKIDYACKTYSLPVLKRKSDSVLTVDRTSVQSTVRGYGMKINGF